jgi:hypothetical protein
MTFTCALISFVPEMTHGVVDFLHFQSMILHDGAESTQCLSTDIWQIRMWLLVQSFGIFLQVTIRHVRHLQELRTVDNNE